MKTSFRNREDAGTQLAHRLAIDLKGTPNIIVLALPRGGVPVAVPVAAQLHAPLDIIAVRKLGLPHDPECAMGAIADPDITELDESLIKRAHVAPSVVHDIQTREHQELARRTLLYRSRRPKADLRNKTVVLIDDGVATGYTLRAAVRSVQTQHPAAIIVAIPVGSRLACDTLRSRVDQIVCLHELSSFQSVGAWYQEFNQMTDEAVCELLEQHSASSH